MSRARIIENILGINVLEYAESYGAEYKNILLNKIKLKEIKVLENLNSCVYEKDSRDTVTYAQNLITNWVLEDYIMENSVKLLGVKIQKNGADKDRKFLSHKKIKGTADFSYEVDEKTVLIEMVTNYTSFWANTKKLHLRDNKYEKLLFNDIELLAVDLYSKKIGFVELGQAKFIPSHRPYGFKPAQEILINVTEFQDLKI